MPQEVCQDGSGERVVGVDRVLAVLKELAGHPKGVTLDALAVELEIPKSSLHRALATLRRGGLAERDGRGRYSLGLELVRLSFAYYNGLDEPRLVEPVLEALAQTYGETGHYAVRDGAEIVYLAKVDPSVGGFRMSSMVGGRYPAHSTSLGKALLAFDLLHTEAVDRFVVDHGPLSKATARTLTTPSELWAEFELTRERGFGLDDQENQVGIVCIAFPVFFSSGTRPAGAISLSAFAHRMPIEALTQAAEEIRSVIHERLGPVTRPGERTHVT